MTERNAVRARPSIWWRCLAAGVLVLIVLVLLLLTGGGAPATPAPGLPDPGPVTGWGLRTSDLATDLFSVITVGLLLFGVVLAPHKRGRLKGRAARAVHAAAPAALLWAFSAAATLLFTVSDFLGTPVGGAGYFAALPSLATQVAEGRALLVVIVLALAIAASARWILAINGAALVLVVAIAGVLPPAFTGHSASAADHDLATSSLVAHVLAVTLWIGGLLGVWAYGRGSTAVLRAAAPRFSMMALVCFVAAGVSGAVNAWLRLGELGALVTTSYGWIVLAKVAAFGALGWFGWWHRSRTLCALDTGKQGAFLRLAGGELVVMATAVAIGVALSRTPTPVPQEAVTSWTPAEALVGHALPPVSFGQLMLAWRPDTLVLLVATLAVVGYVLGVRRLRARGDRWPIGRSVAWIAGVVCAVFVLCGGLATYAPAMFSAHMVQHMTLTMLVPILLALSAPITLALRALPASRRDGVRGAREWILGILHSRVMRVLTHPLLTLALYILTLYAFYFSPLFELAMRSHTAHLAMHLHFLAVGSLYFWPIIGQDPMPRRLPYPARVMLLFASVPFHAFFGVIVMMSDQVIGAAWYEQLALPWVDLLADQNLGGGIAWATGEIPTLVVLIALAVQWRRSDEREARRADRRADRGDDAELAAYNEGLARLAERDRAREENR